MWVSKKEWVKLNSRIDLLEDKLALLQNSVDYYDTGYPAPSYGLLSDFHKYKVIDVKGVISMILERMGLVLLFKKRSNVLVELVEKKENNDAQ